MFTGIVQGLCEVASTTDEPGLRRLQIDLGGLAEGLQPGASVAVDGVCLTAASLSSDRAGFEVVRETLNCTNLGALAKGSRVNIERSCRVGDEIGGHLLAGHVEGVGEVVAVEDGPNERNLWLRVAPEWMRCLHHKGFVALNGASLTIAAVDGEGHRIKVCLIPETLARTTLGAAKPGAKLNLEIDQQTRAVVQTTERVLAAQGHPVSIAPSERQLASL